VGYHFPPDKVLEGKAAAKLRKMLLERSFMERWEPVSLELRWVIGGRRDADQHPKILPDYCYNILDLYARTIFKAFAPFPELLTITDKERAATARTVEEGRAAIRIDWEKLGSVFAAGERAMKFFENEAEQLLKQAGIEGEGPPAQNNDEWYHLIIGDRWMQAKWAEFQAMDKGKPVEEIIVKKIAGLVETTEKAIPEWHQKARDWEPGATRKFHSGIAKGASGFLDETGGLHGEGKLKHTNTYEFLLIFWPEIEVMIRSDPPKRMEDLWNWLLPFSRPYWIEIQDLDQLVSLARSIKLKLKEPGAPRKPRKC
jgi:hypothetical protein